MSYDDPDGHLRRQRLQQQQQQQQEDTRSVSRHEMVNASQGSGVGGVIEPGE